MHACMHTHACTRMHTQIHSHILTYILTYRHTCMHASIHVCIHMWSIVVKALLKSTATHVLAAQDGIPLHRARVGARLKGRSFGQSPKLRLNRKHPGVKSPSRRGKGLGLRIVIYTSSGLKYKGLWFTIFRQGLSVKLAPHRTSDPLPENAALEDWGARGLWL